MNSIEVSYKMDIKFMTSGNSKKHQDFNGQYFYKHYAHH